MYDILVVAGDVVDDRGAAAMEHFKRWAEHALHGAELKQHVTCAIYWSGAFLWNSGENPVDPRRAFDV